MNENDDSKCLPADVVTALDITSIKKKFLGNADPSTSVNASDNLTDAGTSPPISDEQAKIIEKFLGGTTKKKPAMSLPPSSYDDVSDINRQSKVKVERSSVVSTGADPVAPTEFTKLSDSSGQEFAGQG